MSVFKLGQHEERLKAIEADVVEIKADVKILVARDAERRGAWGLAAAIGGTVAFVLSLLFPK